MTENDTGPAARASRALSMSRQLLIIGIIVIVAVSGIFFVLGWDTIQASDSSPPLDSPEIPHLISLPKGLENLTVRPVEQTMFRTETVTDGYIAIDEDLTTPVFSPFSGRVSRVIAKLGDRVERGSPLMSVEATEFIQAQTELIAAKAQFDLAATNEKRQRDLYEAQGTALKDLQQSQVDLATAEGNLAAVRNRLKIFGKTDAEIAALEQMPGAPGMNPESLVSAPISGTVVQRQVGIGQYIQAGSTNPVFSIGDLGRVWLVANVREVEGSRVHVGDTVEVHVLAYPERIFKAKITYLAPYIDPNTHRLSVRADVDNREGFLKPQMFASFTILTGDDTLGVGVPQSAIVYEGEAARVWVSRADGGVELRQIKTGRTNDKMVEVVEGLAPGEKIVTSGALFIDRAATGN
jgi:cobalt-zinc-cadmium efflux system membrane fusion protein